MQKLRRPLSLLGVCAVIILGSGLYLFRSNPEVGAAPSVQSLQAQLAERDRIIAELRTSKGISSSPDLQPGEAAPQEVRPMEDQERLSSDALDIQARLESTLQRIEHRLALLEERLVRAKVVRKTLEEREAEKKGTEWYYGRSREDLNAANQEVRRIASQLNVPEAVTKLSPAEAISDPRYQIYRPYFKARIAAKEAESFVDAAMKRLADIDLEGLGF
jgi:hypothetical protein